MNEISPSAIIPITVTWLVILFMFGLAIYFAFFAPVPPGTEEDADAASTPRHRGRD
ncbi:MAG: hypothetical protein HY690_08850 [Chloroflexi bacterium]|nr:hypothetical protein [Chloroflexota bacterium]